MALSQRQQQRCHGSRRSISAKASFSDDEDAITPCSSPPPEPQQPLLDATCKLSQNARFSISAASSRKMSSVRTWHLDPTAGEDMDDAHLWRRMLDIQREFHCYNSARMAAALLELEMGVDVGRYAPSRSCLDLLNDSVSDLPDEDKERLVEWLHENSTKRKRSPKWKRTSVF
ncbi:hypothetical protein N8I77_005477 [Diaporthe amygdali]|uniref:Uncharacterized protein n=1 Tax=Phomopsis amygdali TaxID=1214568 RepID=A0AAD9SH89_PHOAM|nr:hypothetical protein N8I77_005477 [Diaporthe amygdali]